MAATTLIALGRPKPLEDVLECLPVGRTTKYARRQIIYGPGRASSCIYLVMNGKVGVSTTPPGGRDVLLDIIRPDETFGGSAFLGLGRAGEQATALEETELMSWEVSAIEDLVVKRPRLAMAMLQILAAQNAELTRRMESFAADSVQKRLARALIRLSDRIGTKAADGSIRMMPFTHEMLSRYCATSRELVTHFMNQFRDEGYLSYSRVEIRLFREAFSAVLDRKTSKGRSAHCAAN